MDNTTDKLEANLRTAKADMTFLSEKSSDATAKDLSDMIAAATGGKVTVEQKRVRQSAQYIADAGGSAKFAKPSLIEVTGNKSLSFRI
jgi:hypothetical protein